MLVRIIFIHVLLGEASDQSSPFDEHGYCGRARIPRYPGNREDSELVTVNAFFRHGIRADYRRTTCFSGGLQTSFNSSLSTLFDINQSGCTARGNELIKRYTHGFEVGQLLDYAETQIERLARYLQDAYPTVYNEENLQNLFLRSTDVQRTLGSMNLLLKKLAGSASTQSFFVNTDDFEYDPLNLRCSDCPRASFIADSFTSSPGYKEVLISDEYIDCANRWVSEIGTQFDISQSFDCLAAPACANVPLPGGLVASDGLLQCVSDLSLTLRRLRYGTPEGIEFCQLATYTFMKELIRNVESGISSLWATHDDTLVCILSASGIWDGRWPRYASFVTLETYKDGKIRILWDAVPIALLENISSLIMPGISKPGEYKKVCNEVHIDLTASEKNDTPVGFTGIMLRTLCVFGLVGLALVF
jgi:hypothetical protein